MKHLQLTIEHLAAYLPYGVQTVSGHYLVGVYSGNSDITRPMLLSETKDGPIEWEANVNMDTLLLRPLSQITETIEHNGQLFVPIDRIKVRLNVDQLKNGIGVHSLPRWIFAHLVSWHFDTFGLIEAALAEPIPSIPQT